MANPKCRVLCVDDHRDTSDMLQMLLASSGGIFIMPDDFEKLPLYIQLGCLPIMTGMPLLTYKSFNC